MKKEESLHLFYEKNKIDPIRVCDENTGDYDERLENLDEKIDLWLTNVDVEDRETFLEVLSEFEYLTETTCQKRFCEALNLLKNKIQQIGINIDEILFITVESTNGIKSGGEHVSADFYKRNKKHGITKEQIITSFSKYDFSKISNYKAIVFLDDIVGSGYTIRKAIKMVIEKLKIFSKDNIPLYCMCLIATKRGVKYVNSQLKKDGYKVTWLVQEKWYADHVFKKNSPQYMVFEKYEKLIDDYIKASEKSYFMGFLEAALGVAFHYNTPNNTLSTFWIETNTNKPIFRRDGNQPKRPPIDNLKKIKKITDENAYSLAVISNDKS